MKTCTKCGEVKPLVEFHNDPKGHGGLQSRCKACGNAYLAAYRKDASNKKKADKAAWLAENPITVKSCPRCGETKALAAFGKRSDRRVGLRPMCKVCTSADSAAWRVANPDKKKAYAVTWLAENSEKASASRSEWRIKNPDKNAHIQQRRKAAKLNATPVWANDFFMSEAYHLANLREKATGGKWHVDHIVPLKSKIVCGLHVETNLQVITATENMRKGNRHWPGMPTGKVSE